MSFERNEISSKAAGGTEIMRDLLESSLDPELLKHFQIIMSRPRELDPTKIRIIQCHDLAQDPESAKFKDKNFQDKFHRLVFISNWQYQQYQLFHNLPSDNKSVILESGIDPAPPSCLTKPTDKIRLVYTSTPQRGLEILVPVFEYLATKNPDIHLDVYSSFAIYGWDEADKQFEPVYNKIRNHPQMTYHGFTPNDKLKSDLNAAHIWAYPCTWTETSCRAMLEAMSAGLVCVHPNNGALVESSGSLNVMYHYDQDVTTHANIFASNLNAAIHLVREKKHLDKVDFNKVYVDSRYNINFIKSKWEQVLKQLLIEYPTVESRALPKPQFVYKA
jgi:hypothetical protein